MAKKKKAKLSTFGLVLVLLALVGAVLAVVGLFVSWFAGTVTVLGKSTTVFYGLLVGEHVMVDGADTLPIAVVKAFGIIAAVTAVISLAGILLKSFNVVKISGFAKLLVAAVTIVMGVLALVFTFVFIGQLGGADLGELGGVGFAPAFGAFFTGIGTIVSGASLLLKK